MEEDKIILITRAFQSAVGKGKDCLTPEDYKVAVLDLLGYKPSKYEVSNIWSTCVPTDNEGVGLDKETFIRVMLERFQQKNENELIREMFMTLDTSQRGFLTRDNCLAAFQQVAPRLKEEVVKGLFEEMDWDKDGKITYGEFELMMKSMT